MVLFNPFGSTFITSYVKDNDVFRIKSFVKDDVLGIRCPWVITTVITFHVITFQVVLATCMVALAVAIPRPIADIFIV